jgi:hypothetical protein
MVPALMLSGVSWVTGVNGDAPDIETVVAHEVAHAFLGHDIGDPEPSHEVI